MVVSEYDDVRQSVDLKLLKCVYILIISAALLCGSFYDN